MSYGYYLQISKTCLNKEILKEIPKEYYTDKLLSNLFENTGAYILKCIPSDLVKKHHIMIYLDNNIPDRVWYERIDKFLVKRGFMKDMDILDCIIKNGYFKLLEYADKDLFSERNVKRWKKINLKCILYFRKYGTKEEFTELYTDRRICYDDIPINYLTTEICLDYYLKYGNADSIPEKIMNEEFIIKVCNIYHDNIINYVHDNLHLLTEKILKTFATCNLIKTIEYFGEISEKYLGIILDTAVGNNDIFQLGNSLYRDDVNRTLRKYNNPKHYIKACILEFIEIEDIPKDISRDEIYINILKYRPKLYRKLPEEIKHSSYLWDVKLPYKLQSKIGYDGTNNRLLSSNILKKFGDVDIKYDTT